MAPLKRIPNKIKRKLIQIAAFGFNNSYLNNIAGGRLYKGPWKRFCSPGLNCYSCPAARLSCPIGAMQAVGGSPDFKISFYVTGFLLAAGVLFGRAICGWVCPFGLIQEGIYHLARLIVRALKSRRICLPKPLTYLKYIILAVFVVILPITATNALGMGEPAFCQYICPAGTLEAGIPLIVAHPELRQALGNLFALKASILAGVIAGCAAIERFFCKTLCPLGAILALLNKVSFFRLRRDDTKCISCGRCAHVCPMDVDPVRTVNSAECIRCGKCAAACPGNALHLGFK